jgi:hypothetical protein
MQQMLAEELCLVKNVNRELRYAVLGLRFSPGISEQIPFPKCLNHKDIASLLLALARNQPLHTAQSKARRLASISHRRRTLTFASASA